MAHLVKFTSAAPNHRGEPVYVNLDELALVKQQGRDTMLFTSGGEQLVDEPVEEVLETVLGKSKTRKLAATG